jgi:hypothetical protein
VSADRGEPAGGADDYVSPAATVTGAWPAPEHDDVVHGATPGELAALRRASGDAHLRPYRLTPQRLAGYLAGVRALPDVDPDAPGGEADDPGAVLDADRNPGLRVWELLDLPPGTAPPDPAAALAGALAARPTLAAALRARVPLAEFAAAHLKLLVCVRALLLLAGEKAGALSAADLERWAAAQRPGSGADADFAASLVTAVAGRAEIDAAFAAP